MRDFRTIREKAAYEAGYAAAKRELGEQPEPLTHEQVKAMTPHEIDANWGRIKEGLPTNFAEADDDAE
jgi:hypothetical protein